MSITCHEISTSADRDACFALRQEVFVGEQQVPSDLEWDGQDDQARHFALKSDGKIIATCRVRRIGSAAKIERVAVQKDCRGRGIGRTLMKYVLQVLKGAGNIELLKLSSQVSAIPFYEKLGFKARGHEYIDAGMPHYDMVREIEHD
jgi:predicted GNAT family N-acyltransferase